MRLDHPFIWFSSPTLIELVEKCETSEVCLYNCIIRI